MEKQVQFNAVGDNTSNRYVITFLRDASLTPPPDAAEEPPSPDVTPPDRRDTLKRYPLNVNQFNESHSSIMAERWEVWKNKIDYDYFAEEMREKTEKPRPSF